MKHLTKFISSLLGEELTPETPIAIIGDNHGDSVRCRKLMKRLSTKGVKVVIFVGDKGVWRTDRYHHFVNNEADRLNMVVLFIDGNHEDHPFLLSWPVNEHGLGVVPETKHDPRMFYLRRGLVFELAGTTYLALGGAHSIDHPYRTPGVDWFEEEDITEADVDRAIENLSESGPVDVMLTHDIPAGVAFDHPRLDRPLSVISQSRNAWNTECLRRVFNVAEPAYLFCGHWHKRMSLSARAGKTRVEVLDCNTQTSSGTGHINNQVYITTSAGLKKSE